MVEHEVVTPNLVRPLGACGAAAAQRLCASSAACAAPAALPFATAGAPGRAHAIAVAIEENADAPIAVPRILRRQLSADQTATLLAWLQPLTAVSNPVKYFPGRGRPIAVQAGSTAASEDHHHPEDSEN